MGKRVTTSGRTELDLPEGWARIPLGDVAACRGGYGFPPSEQRAKGGSIPFFKVSDMNLPGNAFEMTGANNYIDDEAVKRLRARLFATGTVIFPKIGAAIATNKKRLLTRPALIDNNVMGLWSIDADRLDGDFLARLMQAIDLRTLSAPGPLPSITQRAVLNCEVNLPPINEQRAIGSVLRSTQQAREATDKVIAATRELKRSLMRHVFTYGPVPVEEAENVALQATEVGAMPEHWQVQALGDICEVKGGKRLPKGHSFSSVPTEFPYLRVVDLKNGSVNLGDLRFLTSEDHETLRRYVISKDDIYISIAGSIGVVGQIPVQLDGAHLTENAAKLVMKDQSVDQRYLVAFLSSEMGQRQIESFTGKTSQPKLALARIAQIQVVLPPIEEQRSISGILDVIDSHRSAAARKSQVLERLFSSLLSELMSGARRVNGAGVIA